MLGSDSAMQQMLGGAKVALVGGPAGNATAPGEQQTEGDGRTGVLGQIAGAYEKSLKTERLMFAGFTLLYVLVALVGLGAVLYQAARTRNAADGDAEQETLDFASPRAYCYADTHAGYAEGKPYDYSHDARDSTIALRAGEQLPSDAPVYGYQQPYNMGPEAWYKASTTHQHQEPQQEPAYQRQRGPAARASAFQSYWSRQRDGGTGGEDEAMTTGLPPRSPSLVRRRGAMIPDEDQHQAAQQVSTEHEAHDDNGALDREGRGSAGRRSAPASATYSFTQLSVPPACPVQPHSISAAPRRIGGGESCAPQAASSYNMYF